MNEVTTRRMFILIMKTLLFLLRMQPVRRIDEVEFAEKYFKIEKEFNEIISS